MELLSNKYDFAANIDKYNAQYRSDGKVTYETIENLYCSPSVKRAIWRTVCLVKEVEKVQGCPPKRIFVEMARGDDKDKKRTKSRKEQLLELYKFIEDDVRDWSKEIEMTEDRRFLSDKLYLYYMQMGLSAYSGKPIRLEEALDTKICDIDHIYPKSKIKDDSIINNKVLCYKTENGDIKQDKYPVSQEIRNDMMSTWTIWHNKGLISDEKFKRLTRNTPLTSEEMDEFIARQLVCMRQSTKEVANILKQMYPTSQVIYSKAGNVVEFKNTVNKKNDLEDIIKVRDLNDLHHAKDAYLNIVVGNVYRVKFNRFYKDSKKDAIVKPEEKNNGYDTSKLFDEKIDGASWNNDTMKKVCKIANKNTPKVVRFTSLGHGKLFDATIERHGKAGNKYIPLKKDDALADTYKYGGYNNASISHFALVESIDKKDERLISLEAIPIYITLLGSGAITDYLGTKVGLNEPKVLIEKIKINSLIKFNGAYYWLRGKTGDNIVLCNANQLVLDKDMTAYLKKVYAFMEKRNKNKNLEPSFEFDKISKEQNITLYDALVEKLANIPYINMPTMPKQVALLNNQKEKFVDLDETQQMLLLMEILHFMQCNSTVSDLEMIGGKTNAGKLSCSKKLNADKEFLLITQSPTGYYRDTVDLTVYYKI